MRTTKMAGILIALLVFSAGCLLTTVIASGLASSPGGSEGDSARFESARNSVQLEALSERVRGMESAKLKERVAVVESQLEELKKDRESDRKINLAMLGSLLTLLMHAGYQIRLTLKRYGGAGGSVSLDV